MEFIDYDRVADTLLYLSDNVTLEFVVTLSTKDKEGQRSFFHSECTYESNKYIGKDFGKSIRRRMNFYFVINVKNYFDASFVLRAQDVMILVMMIENQILPWYFDPNKRIYDIIDKELCITGKYTPAKYARNDIQWLMFEPCINKYENGLSKEAIRLYMNKDIYIDMDIDKFMGFYYILANTDMYSAACSIVTYAKTAPYDINNSKMVGLGSSMKNDDSIWNPYKEKKTNNFFKDAKKSKNEK